MLGINKAFKTNQSDSLGALASGLCLIHCIATPFLFIAQSCSATCCTTSPGWWSAIDYFFIGISFIAVYWSARHSSKTWMSYTLWISWSLLCFIILIEKAELLPLPETSIYIPALALILLHAYNRKYCQCKDDTCCASLN